MDTETWILRLEKHPFVEHIVQTKQNSSAVWMWPEGLGL